MVSKTVIPLAVATARRLTALRRAVVAGWVAAALAAAHAAPASTTVFTVPGYYTDIQSAIDAAADGDEIVVSPGLYLGRIQFKEKNIVLRSTDPTSPTVVEQTIIDANSTGPAVEFWGRERPVCLLEGFTIQHGIRSYGGGIYGGGCTATVRHNVIRDNLAYYGGGIAGCNGLIEFNVITSNVAQGTGGGIYDFGKSATIIGNVISHNEAVTGGGFEGNGPCTLENNTFVGNHADHSGGASFVGATVRNCIFWGNEATVSDPELAYGQVSPVPIACIIEGWPDGQNGNLNLDPRFVDGAHDNYHLLPDSPCIDSGAPPAVLASDFDGNPRPFDATPLNLSGSDMDIGAYEFQGEEVPGLPPAPPQNLSPNPNTPSKWAQPLLQLGAYIQPDAAGGHMATRWQVSLASDFSALLLDSGVDNVHLDSFELPFNLEPGQTFYWRARFVSASRAISPWTATSSTTVSRLEVLVPGDFQSIQSAIDALPAGGEIIVSPGRYVENIQFDDKDIVLRSTDPTSPTVVEQTIIDGNQAGSVLTLGNVNSDAAVLGLTITNGSGANGGGISNGGMARIAFNRIVNNQADSYGSGGGLYFCSGVIENNVIGWNSAAEDGGGMYGCTGLTRGNLIIGNSAAYNGGGIHASNGQQIVNNRILQNSASRHGGGVYIEEGPDILLQGDLIAGNQAPVSGGLDAAGSYSVEAHIESCTIVGNSAQSAGGLGESVVDMKNCIVWGNQADHYPQIWFDYTQDNSITYSCIQDWDQGGEGTFSLDPQFVDSANGDYHLLPQSPCIDAGTPGAELTEDLDGDPRPIDTYPVNLFGSDYDIGYDEYAGPPLVRETPPERPTADSPAAGAINASPSPRLLPSPFQSNAPEATLLAAEFWLQEGPGDQPTPTPLYQQLIFTPGQGWQVPAPLTVGGTYSWRIRYLDDARLWSPWSDFATFTVGNTYYVPDDFPTVQQAIDAAWPDQEIIVRPGTYKERIDLKGKDLRIRSTDPENWSVVKATIIDAGGQGMVVTFQGNETEACLMEGLAITGGAPGGGIGGNGTHATIRRNYIYGNTIASNVNPYTYPQVGDISGGAIFDCDGPIERNIVDDTYFADSHFEGTIWLSPPYFMYVNETGYAYGGAIFACSGPVVNNWILATQHLYYDGSSGYHLGSEFAIRGCSGPVLFNSIFSSGGIGSSSVDRNNIIASSGADFITTGTNDFVGDPKFVDPDYGDLHLQSNSPCIDAGVFVDGVTIDIDGDERPQFALLEHRGDGSGFDIGADEFRSQLALPPDRIKDRILGRIHAYTGGDLNGDGYVDMADWIVYLRSAGNP